MIQELPRVGDWCCTVSGRRFYPEDPRVGDFSITDIAHALGNLCRFAGHVKSFYSVAQHSVYVSYLVPPEDALEGLMHDATEAYLVDLPRPVKRVETMFRYRDMEDAFAKAIATQFGLRYPWPKSVKLADEAMLAAEAKALMPGNSVKDWPFAAPAPEGLIIYPKTPRAASEAFIMRYRELRSLV